MNNIINLKPRAAAFKMLAKPVETQPKAFYPLDRSATRQAREMCILEQQKRWILGSDETQEFKERYLKLYRSFMEPRI